MCNTTWNTSSVNGTFNRIAHCICPPPAMTSTRKFPIHSLILTVLLVVACKHDTACGGPSPWNECEPFDGALTGGNITEGLYQMLKKVVMIFDSEGVDYLAVYGTLLGIARSGIVNPYEVDNDLAVHEIYNFTRMEPLFAAQGLHHFYVAKVFRVCNKARVPHEYADPWDLKDDVAYVYTDIYTIIPQTPTKPMPVSFVCKIRDMKACQKTSHDQSLMIRGRNTIDPAGVPSYSVISVRVGDIFVKTFDKNYTDRWLTALYGNWTVPPTNGTKYIFNPEKWKSATATPVKRTPVKRKSVVAPPSGTRPIRMLLEVDKNISERAARRRRAIYEYLHGRHSMLISAP
eukprot:m.320483 g.320483  ORF g.320483 m.320483 type:complete len:345 (-) comp20321_c0_seq1:224-1258(-)